MTDPSQISAHSAPKLVLSKTRIKMKKSALVILGGLVASCGAFVPADSYVTPTAARRVSPSTTTELNAFVDDMPGAIEPLGFFDPLGFSNTDENTLKRYRESELQHGRVAMLAFVGFLAGENAARTNSAIFGLQVHGPAINHFEQLPFWTFVSTGFVWAWLETVRGQIAFVPEDQAGILGQLYPGYYPGDIGFDPLGLARVFGIRDMQEKELANGRLAMIAVFGIVMQELATGKSIAAGLGLSKF